MPASYQQRPGVSSPWLIETSDSRAQLPLLCSIQMPVSLYCGPGRNPPSPTPTPSASHPLAKAPASLYLPVPSFYILYPALTPSSPSHPPPHPMQNYSSSSSSCPFQEAGDSLGWGQAAKFSAPGTLKNFPLLVWRFEPSCPALYLKLIITQ